MRSYFVDLDGRTYRVVLADTQPTGRPLAVSRQDYKGYDTGPAIHIEGRLGKRLVAKAREQYAKAKP